MPENLNKLVELLSSTNSVLRHEAISALAQFPFEDDNLRNCLLDNLRESSWELRTATADAIKEIICASLRRHSVNDDKSVPCVDFSSFEFTHIGKLDVVDLIARYKPLLSCTASHFLKDCKLKASEQIKLVKQHVEVFNDIGATTNSYIRDDDLDSTEFNKNKEESQGDISAEFLPLTQTNSETDSFCTALHEFVQCLLKNLLDPDWQKRHGAALALSKLTSSLSMRYLLPLAEEISLRLLQLLTLDRFTDFIDGTNGVAPVRESAAQALSYLLLNSSIPKKLFSTIIHCIIAILSIQGSELWYCRFTAISVLRYYFTMCKTLDGDFGTLFERTLASMSDVDDEVVSRSVITLSSLFQNPNIDLATKKPLIKSTMNKVWNIIMDDDRLFELIHDVNSVLSDLLSIVEAWLKTDCNAILDHTKVQRMIRLIDAKSVIRTIHVLKCLRLAFLSMMNNHFETASVLPANMVNALIKSLYRCVLFATCDTRPKDLEQLFEETFAILTWLLQNVNESTLLSALPLPVVMQWLNFLLDSHKCLKVDDEILRCDEDHDESNIAVLCGEEMFSLKEEEQNEMLITRKVTAGRFLGAIIFTLFKTSEKESVDAKLTETIQTSFLPILLANSLYKRFGAAIVVNCFARLYREASGQSENSSLLIPSIFINSLQSIAFSTDTVSYVEVEWAINILTGVINEFQQYCMQRGVPSEELASRDVKDMEEIASVAYRALTKRLTKKGDQDAVDLRYGVVLESIHSAKIAHRTNRRRVHTLFVSALLNFGFSPNSFTPVLKPLFDATYECNALLMEETLGDAFTTVFNIALSRSAHNTVIKMLKSLATELSQSNAATISSELPDNPTEIYSQSISTPKISAKSRNIHYCLSRICEHFGAAFLEICYQFKDVCCALDVANDKQFLANLDFLNLLHNKFCESHSNSNCFKPLYDSSTILNAPWKDVKSSSDIDQQKVTVNALFEHYLTHANPIVRYRVARFLAEFTSYSLGAALNLYYFNLEEMVNHFTNDVARCGAVELLLALSDKEHAILGAVSLFAPLALKMISDPLSTVRAVAAEAFGQFVSILALEMMSSHSIDNLNDRVRTKYELSHDFARVLSCPKELPLVSNDAIPNLRDDISLRQYQIEGITWMNYLATFGLNGILADDMGLGKTLQVLCLLSIHQKTLINEAQNDFNAETPSSFPAVASLIVCPKTLVLHWCHEWKKYFPNANSSVVATSNMSTSLSQFLQSKWSANLVLVASYSELTVLKTLSQFRWNFVILDEGHCIRNSASQLYKVISNIVARHRLILSGTPVQNSPADLWALFNYLMPGYLSTKIDFNSKYLNKVMASRNPKANKEQVEESEKALKALHRRVLPFVMRRLKSDVLKELPEKIVQDCSCEMTSLQRRLYSFILQNSIVASSAQQSNVAESQLFSPLQSMILLRKLVDHPVLVMSAVEPLLAKSQSAEIDTIRQQLCSKNHELSGKMIALKELLIECQIGMDGFANAENFSNEDVVTVTLPNKARQRALIFCQWRSIVELIANYMKKGEFGTRISYLVLDGNVPPNKRQYIVDKFNRDESVDVLILTTQVGGVGLTLTGANIVIFVDHDWNPVVDLQAIDRAHRLGQTRTVNVYRLITQDSVEENVMNLQNFKVNTSNMLIGSSNRSLSTMSTSDISNLFGLANISKTSSSETHAEDGEHVAKRRRITDEETTYSLDTLWETDQYDDAISINSFVENASQIK